MGILLISGGCLLASQLYLPPLPTTLVASQTHMSGFGGVLHSFLALCLVGLCPDLDLQGYHLRQLTLAFGNTVY
jgi:hypothetical protein